MPGRPIYLDHNATTPVHSSVLEAMRPWLENGWGNPSSAHVYGMEAAAAVAAARDSVAELIGAHPDEVVFTGGGTEADNLAVFGAAEPRGHSGRIVVSAVEHPAVDAPARALEGRGWQRDELAVDRAGRIDLERAQQTLAMPADLVSVILAQNETGVVQPVVELVERARRASKEVVVHTDAAQAVGKLPVDVAELGVDLLTVVSHKLYGPKGVGALWIRRGLDVRPLMLGGGQERGIRPGTEPVMLIVGLGAACSLARHDLADEGARQRQLRERLWDLLEAGVDGIRRTGAGVDTLPNTLHVRFPSCTGAEVLGAAEAVVASTGSACHAEDEGPSGALGAMGLSVADAIGAVRLSLGRGTQEHDIERAASSLTTAWRAVRS